MMTPPHSFWDGVWYTFILSLLLWWLAPFGQMIAGYVGGRRTGSPIKGLVAAMIPMGFLALLALVFEDGAFGLAAWWSDVFRGWLASLSTAAPMFLTYIEFSTEYMRTMGEMMGLGSTIPITLLLTIVFGYVGGAMAMQARREIEGWGDGTMHKRHAYQRYACQEPATPPLASRIDGALPGSPKAARHDEEPTEWAHNIGSGAHYRRKRLTW
ncbi:MAG: hypothetical protein AB1665_04655 [Candidatus Thermoplasmatota archaeon]